MGTYIKNSCGGNCSPTLSCSACSVKAKRKSATLNLVGFSPFSCPNSPPPSPNTPITRYLQYQVNCSSAQVGCGTAVTKSASTTYTIDPFTGLQCVTGDESVGCGCPFGSNPNTTCSPTSQTTDCGPVNPAPPASCNDPAEFPPNNTISLSLGQSYTISNVESNVNTMLAGQPFDNTTKFPAANMDAQIISGSNGDTSVSWQPAAPCSILSTLFYKSDYSVTKSELKLDFLGKTKVKVFFTPQAGGEKTLESETEYEEDQSVTISAPSQPGVRTLELVASASSNFSTIASSVTPVTTGQRVSKVRNPPAEGQSSFEGFLAPDCRYYSTFSVESTASSNSSVFYEFTDSVISNSQSNYNFNSTITDSIDGRNEVCEGTWSFNDATEGGSNYSGGWRMNPLGFCEKYGDEYGLEVDVPGAAYTPCNNTDSTSLQDSGSDPGNIFTLNSNSQSTNTRSVTGTTISYTNSSSSSYSIVGEPNNEPGGFGEYTIDIRNTSYNATTTYSWSGELTDNLTNGNSTTTTWESNGGLCSWKTASADGNSLESQSLTANFNVSVNAPVVESPAPAPTYKTLVHWFVVTDDTTDPNCPKRSVRAENRTHVTSSPRVPFSLTDTETLPNNLNVTHCITNMAVTTEVQQ